MNKYVVYIIGIIAVCILIAMPLVSSIKSGHVDETASTFTKAIAVVVLAFVGKGDNKEEKPEDSVDE